MGLGVAALLYLALLSLFPEPREVYGPQGPRLVRASNTPVPPITDDVPAPVAAAERA